MRIAIGNCRFTTLHSKNSVARNCVLSFLQPFRRHSGNHRNMLHGANGLKDSRLSRGTGEDRTRGWYTNQKFMELSVHCCGGRDVELGSGSGKERCLQEVEATREDRTKSGEREGGVQYARTSSSSSSSCWWWSCSSRKDAKLTKSFVLLAKTKDAEQSYGKRYPITTGSLSFSWILSDLSTYFLCIPIERLKFHASIVYAAQHGFVSYFASRARNFPRGRGCIHDVHLHAHIFL